MTLTIDLTPEEERRLEYAAAAQGQAVEAFLHTLIAHLPESTLESNSMPASDSDEEWEAYMRALSNDSEKLPILLDEAFSRESIYGERG